MTNLPGMIVMLLWWMSNGGFLVNNWSHIFTAEVMRLTQDAASPPLCLGTARWWGLLSLDPHMVNHNSRRCNWEESFHKSKYGDWEPGPHRNHVNGQ